MSAPRGQQSFGGPTDREPATSARPHPVVLYCECDHPACDERVELSVFQYEAVRRRPVCYVLKPGHHKPAIERIVEIYPSYVLTEPVL